MERTTDWLGARALATMLSAPLLATILAVLAAGVSRAEPPQPTATITTFSCDNGPAGFVGWTITADFADKGRWIDFEWQVTADDGTSKSLIDRYDSRGPGYANSGVLFLSVDAAAEATATVSMLDNRGGVAASDTVTATCVD